MSRIPKKAMPRAEAGADVDLKSPEAEVETAGTSPGAFSQLAGKMREHPGVAAAGVAAVVGVAAAAAAIPAIRGRGRTRAKSTASSTGKSAGKGRSKGKKKA
ncbi:MAG: hypothetical protein ACT4OE_02770 [Sphingosinicella sp.]